MAINPFSGIIDSNFKSIFNDAISSMLDSTACTVPCTLKYGVTKYDSCANCIYDPIGKKSSNRYLNPDETFLMNRRFLFDRGILIVLVKIISLR